MASGRRFASGANVKLKGNLKTNINHGVDLICERAFAKIGEAIIKRAMGSVRKSSRFKKYSLPGNPVKTHTGVYKNRRNYKNSYSKRYGLVVGPKLIGRGYGKGGRKDGQRASKNIPALMEYGGTVTAPRPTVILAKNTDIEYRRREVVKINKLRRKRAKRSGKKPERMTLANLKWVRIPSGTRRIKPRPTMRLAFNATLKSRALRTSFARVGLGTIRMRDASRQKISTRRKRR